MSAIEVKNLAYRYEPNSKFVLEDISFNLARGQVFGLLGPSGAGKSTTQKLLIGLLKGYQGTANVLGKPASDWGNELYEHIGVSFELPNHFPKLTAKENLSYFASLYQNKALDVHEVLSWLGLEDAADQRVSGFSKGMKNRLSVARALIHDPEIIFLDEPTAGLDPVSTQRVQKLVANLKAQGKTILINTHNMHIAQTSCDQVAFLHQGKIAELDHPDALMRKYGQRNVVVEFVDNGELVNQQFELDDLGENAAFLQLIKTHQVQTIHSSEASLDEVFRRVTGAQLSNLAESDL